MTKIKPTDEQAAARDMAATGETFVLDAPAGSGKTSSAVLMADAAPGRVLALMYNKAAQLDAEKKFGKGVTVKTIDSLAWPGYGPTYGERIFKKKNGRVPVSETARLAGITKTVELGPHLVFGPHMLASAARKTIDRFCYSADPVILPKHVPMKDIAAGLDDGQDAYLRKEIVRWAKKIWSEAIDVNSQHAFEYCYAFKLYASTNPQLPYDAVILDEAQDSNPIVHKLLTDQGCQLMVVGDPAQQIYSWRGAVNLMDRFSGPRLQLTQSFRFGQAVADEAAKWLEHTGTGITVKGLPSITSEVTDDFMSSPDAVLCRSNGAAMSNAFEFLSRDKRVAIVGGVQHLKDLAFAAIDLRGGKKSKHPELIAFSNWSELMAYTEEPGGGDLKPLVQLINQHGSVKVIDACNRIVDEERGFPDVVISTVHKAKGREWDTVQIAEDFANAQPEEVFSTEGIAVPGPIPHNDAMLHYVAVTRAKKVLSRGSLEWIDRYEDALPEVTGRMADAVPEQKDSGDDWYREGVSFFSDDDLLAELNGKK